MVLKWRKNDGQKRESEGVTGAGVEMIGDVQMVGCIGKRWRRRAVGLER